MNNLIRNAILTPDGTVLESHSRHDYRTYTDKNGETYMVDGGLHYLRRTVCQEPYEELSVYDDAPFELVREHLKWGTYGVDGDQPLKWVALCDMESDHIEAVLVKHRIHDWRRVLMINELEWRENHEV